MYWLLLCPLVTAINTVFLQIHKPLHTQGSLLAYSLTICNFNACWRIGMLIYRPTFINKQSNAASTLKPCWLFILCRESRPSSHWCYQRTDRISASARPYNCKNCWNTWIFLIILYKKSKLMGIPVRSMRPAIDDGELQQHVRQLQGQYPNSGNEVIGGLNF